MSEHLSGNGSMSLGPMSGISQWLSGKIGQRFPGSRTRPLPTPADMTNQQLLQAVHLVGAHLLNGLAPVIQQSFARWGSAAEMGDPRFPHAMPIKVRGHVLTMVTEANDAFGLALLGLREHATAAALGAIRFVAETLAWERWLLDDPDEDVRRARAYRRTMHGIESYANVGRTLQRVADQSAETQARWLLAAAQQMKDDLTAMAAQDGVSIPANPGTASKLMEQYVPQHGGYMSYAVLSSAGTHPGPARAFQFYGTAGAGIDYDFKGKHHVRAYWITQVILLHLDVCDLAAHALDWGQEWEQGLRRKLYCEVGVLCPDVAVRSGS